MLVIDMSYSFCGEEPLPLLEAVRQYHNSCGERAWRAVAEVRRLVDTARSKRVPVIFTTGLDQPVAGDFGLGRWAAKCPAETDDQHPRAQAIVAPIAPLTHEILLHRAAPSVFVGTNLLAYLINLKADSLIVCGVSTSGCVRASVVDAFSHGYRVIVAEEATFDRFEASHWINLFDMDLKYADVEPVENVLRHLDLLETGLFDDEMPILKTALAE
jgi:nicotinamidase-related amidase